MNKKNKRATIATVAAKAGLSVATVDRVLNARAPVSQETAARVLSAAEEVGYFAARLIGQRLQERQRALRFGILLLGTSQSFYRGFADAIACAAARYPNVHLDATFDWMTDRRPAVVAKQIEVLAEGRSGLAIVSYAHPLIEAAVARIRARGVPVVALLSDLQDAPVGPYVGTDNTEVGRTLGWLIVRTGRLHQGSVGVLLGGHRFVSHQQRIEGLRTYLEQYAPELSLLEPIVNLDNEDITEEATLELLASHNDLQALCVVGGGGDGVLRALSQLPNRPQVTTVLLESTVPNRAALRHGLVDIILDAQQEQVASALIEILVDLQTTPFDPQRHRYEVALRIMTSENV